MLKRTKLGLLYALQMQYQGILLSAAAFDAGHRGEAVRIANAIFVLLGPRMRNHKAIVDQLGEMESLQVISTADSRGPHGSALIAIEAVPYVAQEAGRSGYIVGAVPFGHEALRGGRRIGVMAWWGEGVLKGAGSAAILTRLDVARVMRDQDGGAHLDDHIKDENYLAVQLKGVGFQYKPSADSEQVVPIGGALEATIRQMAYEVLESLKSLSLTASVTLAHAAQGNPQIHTLFFEQEEGNEL